MPDNANISSDVFSQFVKARALLKQALDHELPSAAAADIRQALRRIERLNDVAALLVNQIEPAPGNRIAEATRAIGRGHSPFSD